MSKTNDGSIRKESTTFEEQFPSLKGEGMCHLDAHCLNREDGVFIREDIEKYCLDKQKVRDALDKLDKKITLNPQGNGHDGGYDHALDDIKEELGLND